MNFGELAQRLGLEPDEFVEILQDFVEVSASDLAALGAAIDGGALQQVIQAAHSVKGAAINFGFEAVAEIARGIESNARRGILQGSREAAQTLQKLLAEIGGSLIDRQVAR